ncbi:hypothetical protein ACGF5C_31520 [Micromonospora sp. NPDC047620]|uniref:hypothetical protein n=1 Tax=Micromonospora sp. NPDC047620 TaxID=3364251 RepID=UPI00371913AA
MPDVCQFVDSIAASPTVRLDLNDDVVWGLSYDGTDLSPPDLRRAVSQTLLTDGGQVTAAVYDNRVLRLRLELKDISADAMAVRTQELLRELDRPTNLLRWRPGTSEPVFFRTMRSPVNRVTEVPGGGLLKLLDVEVLAEPFAYGLKETLPAVTVYNDPAEGQTLNANPYFEADVSGWTGREGAALTWSTAQAHEGVASLLLTPDGVGVNSRAESEQVPVTAGATYRASAWLRCAVTRVVDVQILWYTAGGAFLSNTGSGTSVTAGVWTLGQVAGVAPVGAAFATLTVRMTGTPPASNTLHIDEARIRPVGGTGGACFDVTDVRGDVETPLFLRLGSNVIGSVYDYRNVVMGVRRRGTPSQAPFVLQAEAMTTGTNTTLGAANDPLMSGSGQNYMRVAPAGALMEQRLYMPLWPTAATQDARGRYRVLARMRISAVSDVWSVQFAYGANATLPIRNDAVRVTQTSEIAYYDLGTIQFPVGADPVTDGYSGTETPVAGTRVAVWAQRAAGAGTLDIDCLVFVPADDRYSVTRVWSDTGASAGIIDGAQHMAYAVGGSGEVRMPAQPDAPVGGLPMLSPGQVNRIVWLVDGGSPRDILSSTSTLTPYYWPRYLYTRPPSS